MGANAVTTVYDFTAGQVLTAAQMDNVNCGVPVFATTVTRDAAFGGTGEKTLAEGQACYIEGTGLQIYNGSAWVPYGYRTTFTPTFANFTLGNGTVNFANYTQIGKFVIVEMQVTLGTTSVMGTGPNFTLPVTASQLPSIAVIGRTMYRDTGVNAYQGYCYAASSGTVAQFAIDKVNATYPTLDDLTATVPFTWGSTDWFAVTLTYTV